MKQKPFFPSKDKKVSWDNKETRNEFQTLGRVMQVEDYKVNSIKVNFK